MPALARPTLTGARPFRAGPIEAVLDSAELAGRLGPGARVVDLTPAETAGLREATPTEGVRRYAGVMIDGRRWGGVVHRSARGGAFENSFFLYDLSTAPALIAATTVRLTPARDGTARQATTTDIAGHTQNRVETVPFRSLDEICSPATTVTIERDSCDEKTAAILAAATACTNAGWAAGIAGLVGGPVAGGIGAAITVAVCAYTGAAAALVTCPPIVVDVPEVCLDTSELERLRDRIRDEANGQAREVEKCIGPDGPGRTNSDPAHRVLPVPERTVVVCD